MLGRAGSEPDLASLLVKDIKSSIAFLTKFPPQTRPRTEGATAFIIDVKDGEVAPPLPQFRDAPVRGMNLQVRDSPMG